MAGDGLHREQGALRAVHVGRGHTRRAGQAAQARRDPSAEEADGVGVRRRLGRRRLRRDVCNELVP